MQRISKAQLKKAGRQGSRAAEFECFYEHRAGTEERTMQDRMWYDGRWFQRGFKVTVEQGGGKEIGHIYMFSPIEVRPPRPARPRAPAPLTHTGGTRQCWLRRADYTKFSLRLHDLTTGKAVMKLATGRDG